jgi:hypothetical protein
MRCEHGSGLCGSERLLDALAATNLTTTTNLLVFLVDKQRKNEIEFHQLSTMERQDTYSLLNR